MEYDVVIVGGGPAGLSASIRLKQLAQERKKDISVCVLEKGSQIGAHILSGNVFQTKGLDELIPNWKELGAPLETPVTEDRFKILFENSSVKIPELFLPKMAVNKGNYIISLGRLCEWLGQQAEGLGVEILPGFAGDKIKYNEDGSVGGVITGDMGIAKDGSRKDTFMAGMEILGKQTIFSEGCRGSLTERLKSQFKLDRNCVIKQHYGLGLKEVWEVPEGHPHFHAGVVQHTVNWPLPSDVYAGSFMYHMHPNQIHVGLVIGLDYANPYINPYEEFQKLKTHKVMRKYLEGGECIAYGARCLNEGGFHAIPKLTFPGGLLAGDSAGFLNVAKIKGSHNAIKTGMLAAEAIVDGMFKGDVQGKELKNYQEKVEKSWVWSELKETRNFQSGFEKGIWFGLAHGRLITLTKGREPWTLDLNVGDSAATKPKDKCKPIEYPKHDGKLTFDLLENLQRSGTNHDHDQPSHLRIKPGMEQVPVDVSYSQFGAPEERFCPAKVYEFIEGEKEVKLQINAQNCLHCKCCSIKMPMNYIDWNVPEGGGGPNYGGM